MSDETKSRTIAKRGLRALENCVSQDTTDDDLQCECEGEIEQRDRRKGGRQEG